MSESDTPFVDPVHRVPDDQWGAVVRRADEIAAAHVDEPAREGD